MKDKVLKLIEDLFGDTSVEAEQTLDDLKAIGDDLDIKIDAIEADIARRGE